MALYSLGRRSTVTTSGNCAADLACSTGPRPRIMECGIFLGAATASTYGLQRSTALGTRTSPVALVPEDPADATLTGITLWDMAVAFSAEPTESGTDLRRIAVPASIGAGVVFTFPRGLVIAASGSLVIVNLATNSAAVDVHFVAD